MFLCNKCLFYLFCCNLLSSVRLFITKECGAGLNGTGKDYDGKTERDIILKLPKPSVSGGTVCTQSLKSSGIDFFSSMEKSIHLQILRSSDILI